MTAVLRGDSNYSTSNQGKSESLPAWEVRRVFALWNWIVSRSVVSNSLWPHRLQPTMLLCPWNFPGKNTGVGCHFLFWRIFPTQGSNPCLLGLLHWQADSLPLCHLGRPRTNIFGILKFGCANWTHSLHNSHKDLSMDFRVILKFF